MTIRVRCSLGALALLVLSLPSCGKKDPTGEKGAPPSELKYMPADTEVMVSMRIAHALESNGFAKLKEKLPQIDKEGFEEFHKEFGVEVRNVERMTVGGAIDAGGGVVALRLKEPVKIEDVKKAREEPRHKGDKGIKYQEVTVGSAKMYEADQDSHDSFCLVSDKLLLNGKAKMLKPVLERNKEPEWSDHLKAGMKEADFDAALCMVIDTSKMVKTGKEMPKVPGVDFEKALKSAQAGVVTFKLGSEVGIRAVAVCKDAEGAAEVKKTADAGLKQLGEMLKAFKGMLPPESAAEIVELPGKVKTATTGNLAEATVTVKDDMVIQAVTMGFTMSLKAQAHPGKTEVLDVQTRPSKDVEVPDKPLPAKKEPKPPTEK